jgi:hypothetical protein
VVGRARPDRLRRFDLLAHLLHPRREGGAVVLDLLLTPAAADPKQEAATRNLIKRGDKLGGLDGVARRRWFAVDSLLEGDGFEPSVPGAKEPVFVAESECEGSNPKRQALRIAAGGNEIRTVGTAVKERPFRRTPYGYFSGGSTGTSGLSPMTTGTQKA